ncbi:MAG: hypothetical protein ACSLFO_06125 [Acidimicrobiales bacterium]
MDRDDVEEHRSEITRQNRTTAVATLIVFVGLVLVLLVGTSAGDRAGDPTSTTASTPSPTTSRQGTADLRAELEPTGALVVQRDGESLGTIACCFDGLLTSNEPQHVWAITEGDAALLVDLRGGPGSVVLDLDGHRVLGLAPFGLVTVGADDQAVWRRPDFEPSLLELPSGCSPQASGGGVITCLPTDGRGPQIRRIVDIAAAPGDAGG